MRLCRFSLCVIAVLLPLTVLASVACADFVRYPPTSSANYYASLEGGSFGITRVSGVGAGLFVYALARTPPELFSPQKAESVGFFRLDEKGIRFTHLTVPGGEPIKLEGDFSLVIVPSNGASRMEIGYVAEGYASVRVGESLLALKGNTVIGSFRGDTARQLDVFRPEGAFVIDNRGIVSSGKAVELSHLGVISNRPESACSVGKGALYVSAEELESIRSGILSPALERELKRVNRGEDPVTSFVGLFVNPQGIVVGLDASGNDLVFVEKQHEIRGIPVCVVRKPA